MVMPVGQMILVRAAGPKALAARDGGDRHADGPRTGLGPTLGGLLLEHAGWQWIFFINVPIGSSPSSPHGGMLPREPRGRGTARRAGLVLASVGFVGITYGLAESGSHRA